MAFQRLTDDATTQLVSLGAGMSGSGTAYQRNLIDDLAALRNRNQGLPRMATL